MNKKFQYDFYYLGEENGNMIIKIYQHYSENDINNGWLYFLISEDGTVKKVSYDHQSITQRWGLGVDGRLFEYPLCATVSLQESIKGYYDLVDRDIVINMSGTLYDEKIDFKNHKPRHIKCESSYAVI